MIRIWLDDIRPMPEGFTHWCKTAPEAVSLLSTMIDWKVIKNAKVDHISFDHDLGQPEPYNGNYVARFIEQMAHDGELPRLTWEIHSGNPVGRSNIKATMESANLFWTCAEAKIE